MVPTQTAPAPASVPVASSPTAAPLTGSPLSAGLRPGRHRLRAVDPDEAAGLARVAGFLPPGAQLLPAPPHALPVLPGRPPMVGYLVLVPADEQPPLKVEFPSAQAYAARPQPGPAPTAQPAPVAEAAGPVVIDGERRIALVDGRALDLTYLEFELLAHLVAHPHRVHSRDRLVTTVWGYGHVGDGRTVDVHVARLRRKLGAEHRRTIQTVRRVGYKYVP
ncbi:winged helix-turn-helix domain-containing protein [Streptomyces sp.]|uniref:winged helix-turn-helix domain-containing protein n=1 Tax=Streptomyces sp. TaxID=1931 RepID=UPI002811DED8|nr:winged helix-turn-helix domain-containing protein [Streptomyces sp.]